MKSENGARLGINAKGGKLLAVFSAFFEPAPDSQVSINSAFVQLIDKFSISLVLNVHVKQAASRSREKRSFLVKA